MRSLPQRLQGQVRHGRSRGAIPHRQSQHGLLPFHAGALGRAEEAHYGAFAGNKPRARLLLGGLCAAGIQQRVRPRAAPLAVSGLFQRPRHPRHGAEARADRH